MAAKTMAAIALAVSTLFVSFSAEAGNSHGGNFHQNFKHHGQKHFKGNHRPIFRFYIGGHDRYRDCGYFERKARRTGSYYWWREYKRCTLRHY